MPSHSHLHVPPATTREKLILCGLFLSKFDAAGLEALDFESFVEAFNVIGYAVGGQPASVKNYRDEFDPLFPNKRRGWHKRSIRASCSKVMEQYDQLEIEEFSQLIRDLLGGEKHLSEQAALSPAADANTQFAKRLITGIAAERYFERVQPVLPEFSSYHLENTTALGCGYDYRLHRHNVESFLAVEVKGLHARSGTVSLTPKEHSIAQLLGGRFILFVVKNFRESPFHEFYPDPLAGALSFSKHEQVIVQTSWLAAV